MRRITRNTYSLLIFQYYALHAKRSRYPYKTDVAANRRLKKLCRLLMIMVSSSLGDEATCDTCCGYFRRVFRRVSFSSNPSILHFQLSGRVCTCNFYQAGWEWHLPAHPTPKRDRGKRRSSEIGERVVRPGIWSRELVSLRSFWRTLFKATNTLYAMSNGLGQRSKEV